MNFPTSQPFPLMPEQSCTQHADSWSYTFHLSFGHRSKTFKRLFIAILIKQGWKSLIEFMERLHSTKDIVGACKTLAHEVGHFYL